jgi:spermidine/putrescine transport system ATP-binding protein
MDADSPPPSAVVAIGLVGVGKSFSSHGDQVAAVNQIDVDIEEGEFFSLLGPSGCGKTTTLRMIAGFELPSRGHVLLYGEDVTALPPNKRDVNMVFQNYALFPHMSVRDNVAFGLERQKVDKQQVRQRVGEALELVELTGRENRRPRELSGGQQQRVALARALAPEPPLVLLDEPLSNLDAALRERTRDELRDLLKRLELTAVFVTHDQEEAFALSDRVALLDRGRLQQLATPEELYSNPANPFVASFIGRANFLNATVESANGSSLVCRLDAGTRWPARAAEDTTFASGDVVRLMLRPESFIISEDPADETAIPVRVVSRRFAGAETFYTVQTAGFELLIQWRNPHPVLDTEIHVKPRADAIAIAYPEDDS